MKIIPMRRCVGCMTSKPKTELIRIVSYEGQVSVDRTGKANGRGAYVCPDEECVSKAFKKKALQRSLDVSMDETMLEKIKGELGFHE